MLLIIDIDGSIADLSKRMAIAGQQPDRSNKVEFQKWLDTLQSIKSLSEDEPIYGTKHLIKYLDILNECVGKETINFVYLTGRAEKYRHVTEFWLAKHKFPEAKLIMRNNNDWRSASEYKEDHIKELAESYVGTVIAIDDDYDGNCSEVYKNYGITHLKVM